MKYYLFQKYLSENKRYRFVFSCCNYFTNAFLSGLKTRINEAIIINAPTAKGAPGKSAIALSPVKM
jgi:hypothetical protein